MDRLTLDQALQIGIRHHQAGQISQAEQIYRAILAQQPNHPDALHHLGVIAHRAGQNDLALDLLQRAIEQRPGFADAYGNLGTVLRERGQLDEAIAAYRQATALRPDFHQAHSSLGDCLTAKGQFDQAIAACHTAIALQPNSAQAHNNLGNALRAIGKIDEAIAAFRTATILRPNSPQAHNNLANALEAQGQFEEAAKAYHQAIAIKPTCAEAHYNLGIALSRRGLIDDAIAAFANAIAINANFAEAHNNLGIVRSARGQFDEAIVAYQQAIALRPNWFGALNNLGIVFKDMGRLDEAIAAYRQAIAFNAPQAHSNLTYALHFHPRYDALAIAEEERRWNVQYAQPLQRLIQPHANDRSPDRRLRIGYISGDLRDHVIGRNLLPLLANHDRGQFEITCYAGVLRPDAVTGRFQQHADRWRDIARESDEQVAELVREDQIDILMDLSLHMAGNRLLVFARKPAPVQATFAGYPGSTGLTAIDYRLSDPYLDPPGIDESIYSETTIRLPDSFWCYDPLDCRDMLVNDLPAAASGVITFGCLNNFSKINDDVLSLWAQILRQVNNSRLLMLCGQGSHRQRTIDFLVHQGIEPDRLEFVDTQPRRQYLELYHRIDLGLDSFPYNGHTTSLDSYWMGVPVVTLVGKTAVSRAGWCHLSNLGLTELAAHSPEQFVQIAVDLANDLPRLVHLRSTLRERMERSPLMDAPAFARNIEAAYRQMWRNWCASAFAS